MASVFRIESESSTPAIVNQILANSKEGDAIRVDIVYEKQLGGKHSAGPLNNKAIYAVTASLRKTSDPFQVTTPIVATSKKKTKNEMMNVLDCPKKCAVQLHTRGESGLVAHYISEMAFSLAEWSQKRSQKNKYAEAYPLSNTSLPLPFAMDCVLRRLTRCGRPNVLVFEFHVFVRPPGPTTYLNEDVEFYVHRTSAYQAHKEADKAYQLNCDRLHEQRAWNELHRYSWKVTEERKKVDEQRYKIKNGVAKFCHSKNMSTKRLVVRMVGLLKFATYLSTLRREGEEPAARVNCALTASNNNMNTYLMQLRAEHVLYVDIPVAPQFGDANESFYTTVPLPSDALDRQYMKDAKQRREFKMENQCKNVKVGAIVLADYGEDGLMQGRIDEVSYLSAREVSLRNTSGHGSSTSTTSTTSTGDGQGSGEKVAKAIHVTWLDSTVEWCELPDKDIEINPPFCPPVKDVYSLPNLLDAVRPFQNLPEHPTPAMMADAGTKLLPYQSRFVQWAKDREVNIQDAKEFSNVNVNASSLSSSSPSSKTSVSSSSSSSMATTMDLRLREIVLPAGKRLYLENESTDNILEQRLSTPASLFAGGVVAEEMGLGKTVEIIALALAHPATNTNWVTKADHRVKATLVICPQTLVRQWQTELKRHAPGLKVGIFEYDTKVDPNYDVCVEEYKDLYDELVHSRRYSQQRSVWQYGQHQRKWVFDEGLAFASVPRFLELKLMIERMWEASNGDMYSSAVLVRLSSFCRVCGCVKHHVGCFRIV